MALNLTRAAAVLLLLLLLLDVKHKKLIVQVKGAVKHSIGQQRRPHARPAAAADAGGGGVVPLCVISCSTGAFFKSPPTTL